MKLYAYIEPSQFKAYLAEKKSVETEDSRSAYLREVGTTGILFNRVKVGYVEVSSGSCIRLIKETTKSSHIAPAVVPVPVVEILPAKSTRKWTWCF